MAKNQPEPVNQTPAGAAAKTATAIPTNPEELEQKLQEMQKQQWGGKTPDAVYLDTKTGLKAALFKENGQEVWLTQSVSSKESKITTDGNGQQVETVISQETITLDPKTLDEKTMVKLSEGGELTHVGQMTLVSEFVGRGLGLNDGAKEFFDRGVKNHGSVDAFAKHLETNDISEIGLDSDADPKFREALVNSVRQSGGDSAVFTASMLNHINKIEPVGKPASDQTAEKAQKPTAPEEKTNVRTLLSSMQEGLKSGNLNQILEEGSQNNIMKLIGAFFKMLSTGNVNELASFFKKPEEKGTQVASSKDSQKPAQTEAETKAPETTAPKQEGVHVSCAPPENGTGAGHPTVSQEDFSVTVGENGKVLAEAFSEISWWQGELTVNTFEVHAQSEQQKEAMMALNTTEPVDTDDYKSDMNMTA